MLGVYSDDDYELPQGRLKTNKDVDYSFGQIFGTAVEETFDMAPTQAVKDFTSLAIKKPWEERETLEQIATFPHEMVSPLLESVTGLFTGELPETKYSALITPEEANERYLNQWMEPFTEPVRRSVAMQMAQQASMAGMRSDLMQAYTENEGMAKVMAAQILSAPLTFVADPIELGTALIPLGKGTKLLGGAQKLFSKMDDSIIKAFARTPGVGQSKVFTRMISGAVEGATVGSALIVPSVFRDMQRTNDENYTKAMENIFVMGAIGGAFGGSVGLSMGLAGKVISRHTKSTIRKAAFHEIYTGISSDAMLTEAIKADPAFKPFVKRLANIRAKSLPTPDEFRRMGREQQEAVVENLNREQMALDIDDARVRSMSNPDIDQSTVDIRVRTRTEQEVMKSPERTQRIKEKSDALSKGERSVEQAKAHLDKAQKEYNKARSTVTTKEENMVNPTRKKELEGRLDKLEGELEKLESVRGSGDTKRFKQKEEQLLNRRSSLKSAIKEASIDKKLLKETGEVFSEAHDALNKANKTLPSLRGHADQTKRLTPEEELAIAKIQNEELNKALEVLVLKDMRKRGYKGTDAEIMDQVHSIIDQQSGKAPRKARTPIEKAEGHTPESKPVDQVKTEKDFIEGADKQSEMRIITNKEKNDIDQTNYESELAGSEVEVGVTFKSERDRVGDIEVSATMDKPLGMGTVDEVLSNFQESGAGIQNLVKLIIHAMADRSPMVHGMAKNYAKTMKVHSLFTVLGTRNIELPIDDLVRKYTEGGLKNNEDWIKLVKRSPFLSFIKEEVSLRKALREVKYHANLNNGNKRATSRAILEAMKEEYHRKNKSLLTQFDAQEKTLGLVKRGYNHIMAFLDGARRGLDQEGHGLSVAGAIKERMASYQESVIGRIRRSGSWEAFHRNDKAFMQSLFDQITGNSTAPASKAVVEIAEALTTANKRWVTFMQSKGSTIKFRDDFSITQLHDQSLFKRVGRDNFISEMLDEQHTMFDWAEMEILAPDLRANSAQQTLSNRTAYLKAFYDDVASGRVRDKTHIDTGLQGGNITDQIADHRMVILKKGREFDYHTKYGSGDVQKQMLDHLSRMGETHALVDHLGPDFKATRDMIATALKKKDDATFDAAVVKAKAKDKAASSIKEVYHSVISNRRMRGDYKKALKALEKGDITGIYHAELLATPMTPELSSGIKSGKIGTVRDTLHEMAKAQDTSGKMAKKLLEWGEFNKNGGLESLIQIKEGVTPSFHPDFRGGVGAVTIPDNLPNHITMHEILHSLTVYQFPEKLRQGGPGTVGGKKYIEEVKWEIKDKSNSPELRKIMELYLEARERIGAPDFTANLGATLDPRAPVTVAVDMLRQSVGLSGMRMSQYGLLSVAEFVSEVMTSADLQHILKGLPSGKKGGESIYSRFMRFISQLFGFKGDKEGTLLGESISAVSDLVRQDNRTFIVNNPENVRPTSAIGPPRNFSKASPELRAEWLHINKVYDELDTSHIHTDPKTPKEKEIYREQMDRFMEVVEERHAIKYSIEGQLTSFTGRLPKEVGVNNNAATLAMRDRVSILVKSANKIVIDGKVSSPSIKKQLGSSMRIFVADTTPISKLKEYLGFLKDAAPTKNNRKSSAILTSLIKSTKELDKLEKSSFQKSKKLTVGQKLRREKNSLSHDVNNINSDEAARDLASRDWTEYERMRKEVMSDAKKAYETESEVIEIDGADFWDDGGGYDKAFDPPSAKDILGRIHKEHLVGESDAWETMTNLVDEEISRRLFLKKSNTLSHAPSYTSRIKKKHSEKRFLDTYDKVTGEADHPVSVKLASFFQGVRKVLDTSVLPFSGITAMTSDPATTVSFFRSMGVGFKESSEMYARAIKDAIHGGDPAIQDSFLAIGAGIDALNRATHHRIGGATGGTRGAVNQAHLALFRYNGLNAWTRNAQVAFMDVSEQIFGRKAKTLLNGGSLDDDFLRSLARYDISEKDFRSIAHLVDGDRLQAGHVSDTALSNKFRNFMAEGMRIGILEPNASDVSLLHFGTKAGTWTGEILRTATQYMPFMTAIYSKFWKRMANSYGAEGLFANPMANQRLTSGQAEAMFMVASTLAFANVGILLKDIAKNPTETPKIFKGGFNEHYMDQLVASSGIMPIVDGLILGGNLDGLEAPGTQNLVNVARGLATGNDDLLSKGVRNSIPFSNAPILRELTAAELSNMINGITLDIFNSNMLKSGPE